MCHARRVGFFDDLVVPEEPLSGRAVLARPTAPGSDDARYAPPVDRFVPAQVPQPAVAGAGPETRVLLTGWSVWPRSVTLHLSVFRRTRRADPPAGRQSGLRVGLLFSDGRRVTSLDGTVARPAPAAGPPGRPGTAATAQPTGLIPPAPGLLPARPSPFRTDVDLYLGELPPPGETQLVVEWPDEGVTETHTAVDAGVLRAASGRVIEVWPAPERPEPAEPAEPAAQPRMFMTAAAGGPPAILAPPLTRRQLDTRRREEEARRRYAPRADWRHMGRRGWGDAALVRARLDAGAPPGARIGRSGAAPLHLAAEEGTEETVRMLLSRDVAVDVRDDDGHTPLWYAVHSMDQGRIRALTGAGADVWTPQAGHWSPGRLLLTTPLAPLVADLPGAVRLPAAEAAAVQAADALIAAFGEEPLWTEGLGIAFVRGLGEDELIRRLGADPARCPRAGQDDAPFDPTDFEESLRHVGVRSVAGSPGGCVVTQDGYLPEDEAVLRAISAGTAAYGVYFNPTGGTFGALARDGEAVAREEIGLRPHKSDPDAYWHFRFWQRGRTFPHGADILAYACAAAGLSISDGRDAADLRTARRWVKLPAGLRR